MASVWYYTIFMDENTVFQAPSAGQPDQQMPAQNASEQVQNQFSPQAPEPIIPTSTPPPPEPLIQENYPTSLSGGGSSPFSVGTIIKIVIGLGIIAIVLFLIFAVIIPIFSKKSAGKAEILYWGLWEDKSIIQPVIDDFNKKYPDIKISYVKQDVKQYRKKLSARFDNNTGPDIFQFHNSWVPMFSSVLLPLSTDTISKKDFESSFYPVVQKDLTRSGAIYGLPMEMDTLSLYANTEIFQSAGAKVPATWEDFNSVSRSLTVTDETGAIKTSGAALGSFSNIVHAPDIISMLFAQNGANISDLSSTPKNASEALVFYTNFAKGDQKVWDNTLDNSMQAFAQGKVAMYFGYSWDYFILKAINPELKVEIHQVPRIKDKDMSSASYWNVGVSSKSKFKKETLLFLKFLTSAETQEKLFSIESKTRTFGEPYARTELGGKLKSSIAYPFVSQGNKAVSSFFAGDTYDDGLNSQMNKYLENAVNSIISDNGTSPETAVSKLSEGVNQVIGQYGK